ncbi:hypothetical protein DPMN_029441 [Dreissena polymorpha]|uniref:Ig-like domain-containing protein n=1 Tax=Dreissena polymorpha TaxID=45954 RepID=A0A9D4LX76_DREPO|nr:hypothetical protein DPMN_029441 [Dreissena polymorpha]
MEVCNSLKRDIDGKQHNNSNKIQTCKNNNISKISIKGQLNKTFINVNRQMTGKYTCVASNIHGQSEQSLYLNILYPPSVIRTENVYITEGESINITCKYEPGNPPETAVQWIKADVIYSNKTLLYQRVARTDAGIYTCIATNTYDNGHTNFTGVDSQRFILHVLYQPIVQRFSLEQFDDNLNVTVSENDNVVFNCVAEGFPSPDMRLLKDSVKLAEFNVGNGIGKPHMEVYFLKRLSSFPTKPITSVSHIGLISAGLSVVFILVEKNVGYLFVVPSTPYYNDTTAQPPLVPLDRLDVQGEAIALSSSLPAENVDVHSEIYSEIDPQLVEDIISGDDRATNEAQLI